jgi:hypothetical protein
LARRILVLVLLPALAFGPILGGAAVLLHAHGLTGEHLHVVAAAADHSHVGAFEEWHGALHEHGHDGSTQEEKQDEPAPIGLPFELPRILATPPGSWASPCAASIVLPLALPVSTWHLAPVWSTHRLDLCRSSWPPQRARRSGTAALLRSSHAILI